MFGVSRRGERHKPKSADGKNNIRAACKNRDNSVYKTAQTHRRRKVIQQDKLGNIVRIWDSVTEAIRCNGPSVTSALYRYGSQKHAYGYAWKFAI